MRGKKKDILLNIMYIYLYKMYTPYTKNNFKGSVAQIFKMEH